MGKLAGTRTPGGSKSIVTITQSPENEIIRYAARLSGSQEMSEWGLMMYESLSTKPMITVSLTLWNALFQFVGGACASFQPGTKKKAANGKTSDGKPCNTKTRFSKRSYKDGLKSNIMLRCVAMIVNLRASVTASNSWRGLELVLSELTLGC